MVLATRRYSNQRRLPWQLHASLSVIFHSGTSNISDLPSTVTPTLHALYTRLSATHHHPEISPAQIQQDSTTIVYLKDLPIYLFYSILLLSFPDVPFQSTLTLRPIPINISRHKTTLIAILINGSKRGHLCC